MIWRIPREVDKICEEFADNFVYEFTKKQQERNHSSDVSRWNNCFFGKAAEFGARAFLLPMFPDLNVPDIEIRTQGERKKIKYDTDLVSKEAGVHFHVKTQRRLYEKRFGLAWSVAKWDSIINLPTRDDYAVLTVADTDAIEVVGVAYMPDIAGLARTPDEDFSEWMKKLDYDTIKPYILYERNDITDHIRDRHKVR